MAPGLAPAAAKRFSGKYSEPEIREAISELDALIADGLLFAPPESEADISPENRGAVIKAMCLHAAHDCNMRCAYCFADAGGFAGERSLLPLETGKKAIDFLLRHSGERHNLELDFFGGEPLMNFETVKALTLYGREQEKAYGKHIRFTITTNGLLLDEEKTAFLNEYMDNVILSIDGRPEVNDRMRKTISGEGSYGHIIDNLIRFRENRRGLYYVRGTYTAYNKDFAEDVRYLAGLGFENISEEPVVTDAGRPFALTEKDLPELFLEYDRLADLILEAEAGGAPISFFHFEINLSQGPCVFKRAAGCGAGTEYVAVSPEGDIYPCHQFVGDPAFKLGNVADELFENQHFGMFNRAHIFNKEACRGCWAKYYCSGGCHASALHYSGDLMTPHAFSCALERKRIEIAIALRALRS
jgi:uncharacterized protein